MNSPEDVFFEQKNLGNIHSFASMNMRSTEINPNSRTYIDYKGSCDAFSPEMFAGEITDRSPNSGVYQAWTKEAYTFNNQPRPATGGSP